MASAITTTNIDITFPVPGQDNDTQGFRTNFGAIKNALDTASAEITDLQVIQSALISLTTTPPQDPTGFVGNVQGTAGQIYATTGTVYICTQSYDINNTSTHIWAKIVCTPW